MGCPGGNPGAYMGRIGGWEGPIIGDVIREIYLKKELIVVVPLILVVVGVQLVRMIVHRRIICVVVRVH